MIEYRFTLEKDLKQLPWLYRQYHHGDTMVETNYDGMLKEFKKLQKMKIISLFLPLMAKNWLVFARL